MRIAVGADHAGTPLNETATAELRRLGHEVVDLGTHDPPKPDDYPDRAAAVAQEVVSGRCERGLLICGSGVGVSVAANKLGHSGRHVPRHLLRAPGSGARQHECPLPGGARCRT